MNAAELRGLVKEWIAANLDGWRDLRAAHLVGSVAGMQPLDPVPSYKDVDLHLVFEAGSPVLQPTGPFPNQIEIEYKGILIEAGLESVEAYSSAEAVLINPKIAHHLTTESILFDPDGILASLQPQVRAEYAKRVWVTARLESEIAALTEAMTMQPMARAMFGASGEVNLLGYSMTFVAAAMQLVVPEAPTTGSRALPRLRELLSSHGRADLYESLLSILGLNRLTPGVIAELLSQTEEAFDLAASIRKSPHPFQHKLHAHLKPYLVESCRLLLEQGLHREALHWMLPFFLSSCDVILADAPEETKPSFRDRQHGVLTELGFDTKEALDAALSALSAVHSDCFSLAREIAAKSSAFND